MDAQELEATWDALAAAALVGTGAGTPPTEPPAMLRPAWDAVARDSAETTLLARAALVAQVRRSAVRPGPAAISPVPDGERDERPALRATARARLSMLLAGTLDAATLRLLEEWLALAKEWQPVPELLPKLLAAATSRPSLRPLVLDHAGPRGRWLASLMPGISWANVPVEPDWNAFETADRGVRAGLLRALRSVDANRARVLLESAWESEDPAVRAELLPALEIGLSDDDEPFLEACLDDRRKEVRKAAATLLRRLPNSRLVARMQERIASWIRLDSRGFEVVRLPDACDKPMQRDGVEPKPPPNVGEKAHWMAQVVAAVPLSWWTRTSGATPDVLVKSAAASEWKNVFLPAWPVALLAGKDAVWAKALLFQGGPRLPLPLRVALVRALPPKDRQVFLIAALAASVAIDGAFQEALALALSDVPWDETLGRAVLEALPRNAGADFRLMQAFADMSYALPPELSELAISLLPPMDSALGQRTNTIERFVDVMQFRQAMHKELAP